MRIILLFAAISIAIPALALELDAGGQTESFTDWGLGVRSEGMGRTMGTVADDATAIFWNPGGLYQLEKGEIILSSGSPYMDVEDIYVNSVSFAYPMRYNSATGESGTFGTVALALGYYTAGTIYEANPKGLTGRTFSNTDLAFYFGYSKDLNPKLGLGLAMKSLSRKIHDYRDTGFGLDLGVLYKPIDLLNVSIVARNLISPTYRFDDYQDEGGFATEVGTTFNAFGYGNISWIFEIDRMGYYNAKFGAEITPIGDYIALRGGYDLADEQPRAGLGLAFGDFDFDYAIRLSENLGLSHLASVSFHFGGPGESAYEEWEDDENDYIDWDEEEALIEDETVEEEVVEEEIVEEADGE